MPTPSRRETRFVAGDRLPVERARDERFEIELRAVERRRTTDDLRRAPAERDVAREVPHVHVAGSIEREDRDRRRLHDRAQCHLAAPPRILGVATVGDIASVDDIPVDGGVVEQVGDASLERPQAAVAMAEPSLHEDGRAGLLAERVVQRNRVDIGQRREPLTDELLRRVSEQRLHRRTDVRHHTGWIQDRQEVGRMRDDRPEPEDRVRHL